MTLSDCTAILAPLALLLRVEVDAPTFRAYYQALKEVPVPLLQAAVDRASQSAKFFPKPAELRQWAEEARQAILRAHPYEGCAMCSRGWIDVQEGNTRTVRRCFCWAAHRDKLAELGVGGAALALPEGREAD